jgi:hypothetical protein
LPPSRSWILKSSILQIWNWKMGLPWLGFRRFLDVYRVLKELSNNVRKVKIGTHYGIQVLFTIQTDVVTCSKSIPGGNESPQTPSRHRYLGGEGRAPHPIHWKQEQWAIVETVEAYVYRIRLFSRLLYNSPFAKPSIL